MFVKVMQIKQVKPLLGIYDDSLSTGKKQNLNK